MERILIVRLGAMGDVVHTLPAVAALRAGIPEVRIGWVIEERWADLLAAEGALAGPGGTPEKPLVDAIHLVNTKAWRSALFSDETWRELRAVLSEIRASKYDIAVDFQGAVKSAFFARWSGAPVHIGLSRPKERAASMMYTHRVPTTKLHVVEENLELAAAIAPNVQPPTRDLLPHDPVAEEWCEAELKRRAIREFVVISPGAGWGAKAWPAERYGETARALSAIGLAAVVNFGPGEEELARAAVAASGGSAQAISCAIAELIALTRRARLCIGGDTGPTHLAAMLGVPVVTIFGPTDPRRNGPYGSRSIVLRSEASQTSYSHSAKIDAGLLAITVEQVADASRRLLEAPRG
jgi:heptosyltransferase-1